MKHNNNITVINALRGIAALMVTFYHFTMGYCSENSIMSNVFGYGWSGVEIFFVISGFVITWTMIGYQYKTAHFKTFIIKRIIRIEPPYLISIVLVIFLNYLSSLASNYKGMPFEIDINQILLHIGYMVRYFHDTWLSPVYWTLEIEFHFYILIAISLPLFFIKNGSLKLISILCLWSLIFISNSISPLFKYMDIFLLGITLALHKSKNLTINSFSTILILLFISVYLNHKLVIFIVTLLTTLLIHFKENILSHSIFNFFGKISFSLYLLHVPLGGRIINLAKRLELNEYNKIFVILLSLAFTVAASYLFYIIIEKPFHLLSQRIKFKEQYN